MYTFILIIDSADIPKVTGHFLQNLGTVKEEANGSFMVEGEGGMQDGWISIVCDENVLNEYEINELQKFREIFHEPCFFVVSGRDTKTNFANNFILGFDQSIHALIDNDHGLVESMDIVKSLVHRKENWLHRNSLEGQKS